MSQSPEVMSFQRAWLSRVTHEVNALARNRNPQIASWRGVKQAILEAATNLRLEANQSSPPVELDRIKEIRHIYEETTFNTPVSLDAVLAPTSKGFVLRLPKGQHEVRRRFSIAHEIGHTFFYDINKNPPVRLISQASSSMLLHKEENICSAFARELLIPREFINNELFKFSDNNKLKVVLNLASRYKVSAEVMMRRLLTDLSHLETTMAIFKGTSNFELQGAKAYIRWYKGKSIRQYLRKREEAVFNETLKISEGAYPYSTLDDIANRYADIGSIQWKTSKTGSQLIVFLNFKR